MGMNVHKEVAVLGRMTTQELRGRYAAVFGEATTTGNKPWLVRRIAWRLQADAEGGLTDRAKALTRLLAGIAAGRVDCVAVYKVDRLSRSLLDFARLMQAFDEHRVSFVSVTQQFDAAASMGRLVLDVLRSFARFERGIISERPRDKIAATRRKARWAGGHPPA